MYTSIQSFKEHLVLLNMHNKAENESCKNTVSARAVIERISGKYSVVNLSKQLFQGPISNIFSFVQGQCCYSASTCMYRIGHFITLFCNYSTKCLLLCQANLYVCVKLKQQDEEGRRVTSKTG